MYRRGKDNPAWKGGKSKGKCVVCQKEFDYWPSGSRGRFCSSTCYHQYAKKERHGSWKGGKIMKTCLNCGETYYVIPAFDKTTKYCSRKCLHRGITTNGSHIYRRMAIQAYGKKCMDCGRLVDGHFLHVHHIDKNQDNYDIKNLKVLCAACHGSYHNWGVPNVAS